MAEVDALGGVGTGGDGDLPGMDLEADARGRALTSGSEPAAVRPRLHSAPIGAPAAPPAVEAAPAAAAATRPEASGPTAATAPAAAAAATAGLGPGFGPSNMAEAALIVTAQNGLLARTNHPMPEEYQLEDAAAAIDFLQRDLNSLRVQTNCVVEVLNLDPDTFSQFAEEDGLTRAVVSTRTIGGKLVVHMHTAQDAWEMRQLLIRRHANNTHLGIRSNWRVLAATTTSSRIVRSALIVLKANLFPNDHLTRVYTTNVAGVIFVDADPLTFALAGVILGGGRLNTWTHPELLRRAGAAGENVIQLLMTDVRAQHLPPISLHATPQPTRAIGAFMNEFLFQPFTSGALNLNMPLGSAVPTYIPVSTATAAAAAAGTTTAAPSTGPAASTSTAPAAASDAPPVYAANNFGATPMPGTATMPPTVLYPAAPAGSTARTLAHQASPTQWFNVGEQQRLARQMQPRTGNSIFASYPLGDVPAQQYGSEKGQKGKGKGRGKGPKGGKGGKGRGKLGKI